MRVREIAIGILACLLAASGARADSLKSVAKHLAKAMAHAPNRKVAILPFPYHDGSISSGSSIVSEHMTMLLADRSEVQVIERTLLDKVLQEEKLELSGLTDSESTRKLGKILGVDAVVSGTLIDLDNGKTEVNARLIQTETGAILAGATTRVKRTWKDLPRLPEPPAAQVAAASKPAPEAASQDTPAEPGTVSGAIFTPTALPAHKRPEEVLVLTNDDLIPYERARHQTAEQVVDGVLQEEGSPNATQPAPELIHIVRRVYQRHPDANVRARALYAMGTLLQRQGRRRQAAVAYNRLLKEFPRSNYQTQAHQHLSAAGFASH